MNNFLEILNHTLKLVGEKAINYEIVENEEFDYTVFINNRTKKIVFTEKDNAYLVTVYEKLGKTSHYFKTYSELFKDYSVMSGNYGNYGIIDDCITFIIVLGDN